MATKRNILKLINILLLIVLFITAILISIGVYLASDNELTSYLVFYKFLFIINLIMTIASYYKSVITDPGKITHLLNPHIIEFYLNIREEALLRGVRLNETYAKYLFKDNSIDYNSDEYTDYDSFEYEAVTSIQNDLMEQVSKENNITLKRCDRCFVVRVPGVRHCSRCQACILKMDHHCPWSLNCVGQFNQKFFLQFLFYNTCGLFQALIIIGFYTWYKNREVFYETWSSTIFYILTLFLLIIFLIFDICMISDQWSSVVNEMTVIDLKKKRFIEKRTLNEVLIEIFGDSFGLQWFIPIRKGGFHKYFSKFIINAQFTLDQNQGNNSNNNKNKTMNESKSTSDNKSNDVYNSNEKLKTE